jgi:hypothetical protein
MKRTLAVFSFLLFILSLGAQEPLITHYNSFNADTVIYTHRNGYDDVINRPSMAAGFASFPNGDVLMVWSIRGIYPDTLTYYVAQRQDKNGNKAGKLLFLDTVHFEQLVPVRPKVVALDDKSFLYSFLLTKKVGGHTEYYHYYRKYDLGGNRLSRAIPLDTSDKTVYSYRFFKEKNNNLLIAWKSGKQYRIKFRIMGPDDKPVTDVLVADTTQLEFNADYSIDCKNDLIAITWQLRNKQTKNREIYFRLFDLNGHSLTLPQKADNSQQKDDEAEADITITNKKIYIAWISSHENLKSIFKRDSCTLHLSSFDLKGKFIKHTILYVEEGESASDNINLSSHDENVLCTWWTLSVQKNDTDVHVVRAVLMNEHGKMKKFDLLKRAELKNRFGQDFEFPIVRFIDTGEIFITWSGRDAPPKTIWGNVYWARTSLNK